MWFTLNTRGVVASDPVGNRCVDEQVEVESSQVRNNSMYARGLLQGLPLPLPPKELWRLCLAAVTQLANRCVDEQVEVESSQVRNIFPLMLQQAELQAATFSGIRSLSWRAFEVPMNSSNSW